MSTHPHPMPLPLTLADWQRAYREGGADPHTLLADWLTGRQPIPADCDTPMLRAIRRAAEDGEGQPK